MKILVTGSEGYIGSVLCTQLLSAGHDVFGIDSLRYKRHVSWFAAMPRQEDKNWGSYNLLCSDLLEEQGLALELAGDADVVVHLAAIVGEPACNRDQDYATQVNLDFSRELAISLYSDQLLIYPNTNSGYGIQSGDTLCTEETPLTPISHYGKTKCDAEIAIRENHDNAICLRLATVCGLSGRPRLDLLVNQFTHDCFFDKKLTVYEPQFKRNFVHVFDVARCIIHCIENRKSMGGQVYNLGDDRANMTKGELAMLVGKATRAEIDLNGTGTDPDKRDYIVSSKKLYDTGFECHRTVEGAIQEIVTLCGMMPKDKTERRQATAWMRNV